MRTFATTLMILAFVVVSMAAAGQARAQGYSITDLGANVYPMAINDTGQATGYINNSGQHDAMFYNNGAVQDLGTFGNVSATGSSINASGQIAITTTPTVNGSTPNNVYGYVYNTATQTQQYIGQLDFGGSASSINNAGQVVGQFQPAGSTNWHDFTYQNGTFSDIGTFGGQYVNYAPHVNNSGQIAGSALMLGSVGTQGFISGYNGQNAVNIGTLGALSPMNTVAYGLNDSGAVVGFSYTSTNAEHAFIYQNGTMTDLNNLLPNNSTSSQAKAINANGDVTGLYRPAGASSWSAFIYENGQMFDLGSELPANSGWTFSSVYGINDEGQIVGYGSDNGVTSGFLLTPETSPAPIPGAVWLLGSGLAGLIGLKRKYLG